MTTQTVETVTPIEELTKRLAETTARHAAATKGPYFWWGNTDNHQAGLAGRGDCGVTEVITTVKVDRKTTDRYAVEMREYLICECEYSEEAADAAVDAWVNDEHGSPRSDHRLALSDTAGWLKAVEEIAVYTVARSQGLPDDTPREHAKVYRADICDVRDNPNGEFLKHTWSDVAWMSEALARVTALVSEKPASRRDENGYFHGLVSMPEGSHRTTGGRASCADCSQWCYEHAPCACCWAPIDPADLIAALTGRPSE